MLIIYIAARGLDAPVPISMIESGRVINTTPTDTSIDTPKLRAHKLMIGIRVHMLMQLITAMTNANPSPQRWMIRELQVKTKKTMKA